MREPSDEANLGAGVEPNPDCGKCKGSGFFYYYNWARTCFCKTTVRSLSA